MAPKRKRKITVLIPCYNEEDGIVHVLRQIPHDTLERFGYETRVIVVDNNSTDKTARVARQEGARVISEPRQGKGNALRTGLQNVEQDSGYVVIVDGDDTYKCQEILRMIEPLEHDFCDIVVGSRLGGKISDQAFSRHHRMANWVFTFLVRHFYNANITDTLSGFISMKKEVADAVNNQLTVDDFRVEMELITKAVRMGFEMASVPITYDRRIGYSKIQSYTDGAKILHTFFKNFYWRPE